MPKNEYRRDPTEAENIKLPMPILRGRFAALWADISHGRLMQYFPYVLYVVFLGVCYIGNRHHIDRIIREMDMVKQEVEALRADYVNAQAVYMYTLKRTEVVKRAKALGLRESPTPPEVIYIED